MNDSSLFNLEESVGALSFISKPDFEFAKDEDKNNEYLVNIKATDSEGNSSIQTVAISIEDVQENQNIKGNSFYTLVEGRSWGAANQKAKEIGGNLASIGSEEEDQYIWNTFANEIGLSDDGYNWGYWIGLRRDPTSSKDDWNNWYWESGEEKKYQNKVFNPGNPTSEPNGNDSPFVHVWGYMEGTHEEPLWDDTTNLGNLGTGGTSLYGVAEVPLSYFSISDLTIKEGDSGTITISRSGGLETVQNLNLTSEDSTALVGEDYELVNENISFKSGEESKLITIKTLEDSDFEMDEEFILRISPSTSDLVPAQINDESAKISIENDDNAESLGLIFENKFYQLVYKDHPRDNHPNLAISSISSWWSWGEENKENYRIELFGEAITNGGKIAVLQSEELFDLWKSTFANSIDFSAYCFYPFENSLGVTILKPESTNPEWPEPYFYAWNNNDETSGYGPEYAIAEYELSYFSISDLNISEGNTGNLIISRSGGINTSQNIILKSSDSTANEGTDYDEVNKTILFSPGESSKNISISTIQDENIEFNEEFILTINASSDDLVPAQISNSEAVITIEDNDAINTTDPIYSLSVKINIPREGYFFTTTVSTQNVAEGTTLYWSLSGENIDISDFALGELSGSGIVNSTGNFSFMHNIANDGIIEGYETIDIKLFSDEERTNQIAATRPLTIQDSAITEQIADIITDLQGISKVVTNLVQGQNYTLKHIRDFDGNSHANSSSEGVDSAYKYQNTIDINGDGIEEAIYTNLKSGRWVTASIDPTTGKIDYSDYGEGGTTRVVGIYDDPLIAEGSKYGGYLSDGKTPAPAQFGATGSDRYIDLNGDGDFDDDNEDRLALNSQVRFQRDLEQDNLIAKVSNDYDGDGVFEVYWKTSDNTAYLRALMHDDGNIRYANYQNEQQMTEYLTNNGFDESTISEIIA